MRNFEALPESGSGAPAKAQLSPNQADTKPVTVTKEWSFVILNPKAS
jgi:hypothetical protein